MNRPADGLEQEKIMQGVSEGERIEKARLYANEQGKLDERFNLKSWIEWRSPIKRWILKMLLLRWFDWRTRNSHDYGLGWNDCDLQSNSTQHKNHNDR